MKKVQEMLLDARRTFVSDEAIPKKEEMLFSEYLEYWLGIARASISIPRYSSYATMLRGAIKPYFEKKQKTLAQLSPRDI